MATGVSEWLRLQRATETDREGRSGIGFIGNGGMLRLNKTSFGEMNQPNTWNTNNYYESRPALGHFISHTRRPSAVMAA
jgi:hypothetical protein